MPTSSDEESYSYKTYISDEELDYNPCQSCVLSTNCLENVFPALDTEENQFAKMPDTDYILISLDFHHICVRELSVSIDGTVISTRFYHRGRSRISRHARYLYMTPLHYIVEEFENQDELDQSPYLFAFGRSRRVQEKDLAYRLYRVFSALRKKNRRKDEVEQGRLRQLILLTFDTEPVKTALLQLTLEWLAEPNVQIWDLKKENQFQTRLQQPAVFEHVLERLGIRFEDTQFGKLTSCSGNATVFMIQTILAFSYKNAGQKALLEERIPLTHHTNITHTNKSLQIIEDIITMSDNEVADKNIAHNEIINDKSIDDKMADEKINDNKTTEEITAEEKIEETSKDDEMTDAQHSDGESAEDEIERLWAMCGPLHGIETDYLGIVTRAKRYTDKLEGRVIENAKVLEKLLEETPEPFISGKDKRPITDKDLDYFIADLDYFAEVEDDGNEESETLDEEDEHDSDYELPRLDDFSHSPER
ncbi:hypothetical protein BKA60DRAFT_593370 [Fusarium oxysporum]|nr:hypothetical protein BKA60DRAFT_593370 [Fusarium oxysporum]